MTRRDCEPLGRTSLRAFHCGEHLLLVAEGELPSPGYDVDIERSLLDVEPPAFTLLRCVKSGFWPQVITPYRYCEIFRIGPRRDHVLVHHADATEPEEVEVEDLPDKMAPGAERFLRPAEASASGSATQETTGQSRNLSFDEAFANALQNLPGTLPSHPDQLTTVDVVDIGALFGGIAGFNHLFVRVRASSD